MLEKMTKNPLPEPSTPPHISADIVAAGQPMPAIDRIKIFSHTQWEEFVLEWADSLREEYSCVERCGGAGDMGRDIIATCKDNDKLWDNYQCKHYNHPLAPADIWVELGKLVYHTHQREYGYPHQYFFVAPQGAGTKLSNLFKNQEELRNQLITNWDKHCRLGITSNKAIGLEGELKTYLLSLDFSIFSAIPPLRIIDAHAKTRWHIARFGGGLPQRPSFTQPPETPTAHEANYVKALFNAYTDHLKRKVQNQKDLEGVKDIQEHFQDSRIEFYSAEALRAFSRDTLPPSEYEKLQDEMHAGIRDEIRANHPDGYQRVVAVTKTARTLQLSGHALHGRITTRDRGGICHQLANNKIVKWVK